MQRSMHEIQTGAYPPCTWNATEGKMALGYLNMGCKLNIETGQLGVVDEVVEDINNVEAWLLMQSHMSDNDLVILDMRSPVHYKAGHLKGAVNLEYVSPSSFEDRLSNLDRNKTYLVYCYGGGRSAEAVTVMDEKGFNKVFNMQAGFDAWRAAECSRDLRRAA